MADNTTLDAGSGGDTIRTEDRTTFKTPVSLIDLGGTSSELIAGDTNALIYTDDTSTHSTGNTRVIGVGFVATPTDGSVGSNDIGMPAMSTDRRVHVDAQIVGTDSALDVSGANLTVVGAGSENAAVSGNPLLIGARYDSTPRTLGDGDVGAIALAVDGAVHVDDGGNAITVDAANDASLTCRIGDGSNTATIRNLIANDALNVALVDGTGTHITSVVGTEYAVDAALGATPTGTLAVAIRDDALTTLTPVEGDAIGLRVDSTGALWTQDINTTAILADTANIDTNIGTIAGTVSGSELQVDVVAALPAGDNNIGNVDIVTLPVETEDAAVAKGPLLIGGRYDTTARTLDNGDAGAVALTAAGAVQIGNDDLVSTNNSTTSTLNSGIVFTGTGDDCLGYSTVTIQLDASHDSAVDGMTFQFSTDNSNWDDVYQYTYTAANGARRFQFPVTARYFRIVYTNGGTNQTHFRVQTILHRQNTLTSIHRLVSDMSPDRSAQVVKSVIFAQAAGSGDFVPVDSTAAGNLKVALEENDAGNLTTNVVQLGGSAIDVGNGAVGSATQRVTIASDTTGVLSVDDNGANLSIDLGGTAATLNTGTVDGGTQRVTLATDVALPAGTNAIGKLAANSGVDIGDVDVTSIAAGSNLIGNVGIGVRTSGGATIARFLDVDESEDEVKNAAGQVYSIHAFNLSAGVRYLKLYNKPASAVTVGTTAPVGVWPIPTQGDTNGAGFVASWPMGVACVSGICIAATTGLADASTGAPAANDVVATVAYA